MSANITNTNGTAEMMYTGQTPWHGLGKHLDNPANAAEAIEAANLGWKVETMPIYTNINGTHLPILDKAAIVRMDTQDVFNVLSNRYTPVQNTDAFGFFDAVVGAGEAIYHTAGSLDGGRRVWILAKLSGELKVVKKDILEKYILLANSHDGTKALTMQFTPIRVVCQNTLSIALSGDSTKFYARHTPNVMRRAQGARELLGLSEAYFENFLAGSVRLVAKTMNQKAMQDMLTSILRLEEHKVENSDELYANKRVAVETIMDLFESGAGNTMVGVKGTAWGAFNAVTEYIDHVRPAGKGIATLGQKTVAVVDKRLDSSWFGGAAQIRQGAWDYLLELSGVSIN